MGIRKFSFEFHKISKSLVEVFEFNFDRLYLTFKNFSLEILGHHHVLKLCRVLEIKSHKFSLYTSSSTDDHVRYNPTLV